MPEEFRVYVYEKSSPTNGRDGFHILFSIVLDYKTQIYLRDMFLKEHFSKIFPDIVLKEQVFDLSVIKQSNWTMNGSRSKSDGNPYIVSAIYNETLEEINESISSYKLSVRNNKKRVKEKNEYIEKIYETNLQKNPKQIIANIKKNTKDKIDIDLVKKLVNLLNIRRAKEYHLWIQVGWALSSIGEECYDLWIDFSKQVPNKFELEAADKIWNRANGDLTIGSIHHWAKEDNPDEYKKIQKEILNKNVNRITLNNVDTAKLLYELYGYNYCYVLSHDKTVSGWYKFYNHRWNYQQDGYDLRKKLTDEIRVFYKDISYDISSKMYSAGTNDEKEMYNKVLATISSLIAKLGTTNFLDNVIKECTYIFRDTKLLDELDNNPYLIGFNNGIYDLKNEIFREGCPQDYISLNTKINYNPNADINIVNEFLKGVMPDNEVRDYLLLTLASSLDYINREEKFYIWIGGGRNGKSIIVDLHQRTLGQYTCALPVSLITQKRPETGRAVPEIAKMFKKRFCIIKEPDTANISLNTGVIKELTGNDTISVRKLYHNDNEFRVSSKLYLMTNNLPDVNTNEPAIWDRIRVIPFEMHFCDNPKKENDRLIDKTIKEKLKDWTEGYMLILLKYYKFYKDMKTINEPKKIMKATNQYRERNNVLMEYINEFIEEGNKRAKIPISRIYSHYSSWHKDEYPRRNIPSKKEFTAFLIQQYASKVKDNELIGYSIKH